MTRDAERQRPQPALNGFIKQNLDEGSITVPVPDHSELAFGTLLAIVQSRIERSAFES